MRLFYRYAIAASAALVVIVALSHLQIEPSRAPDLSIQLGSAKALAEGHGYIIWQPDSGFLNRPVALPNGYWPVGYSASLAVPLSIGLSAHAAVLWVRGLGMLLTLAAWGWLLVRFRTELGKEIVLFSLLYVALIFNPLWLATPSEVWWLASAAWGTVAFVWATSAQRGPNRTFRFALAGLTLGTALWFKLVGYALLVVPVVAWLWWVCFAASPGSSFSFFQAARRVRAERPAIFATLVGIVLAVTAIRTFDLLNGGADVYSRSYFNQSTARCYHYLLDASPPLHSMALGLFNRISTYGSHGLAHAIGWALTLIVSGIWLVSLLRPSSQPPAAVRMGSFVALTFILTTFALLAYTGVWYCLAAANIPNLANPGYYYPVFPFALITLAAHLRPWLARPGARLIAIVLLLMAVGYAGVNMRGWFKSIRATHPPMESMPSTRHPLFVAFEEIAQHEPSARRPVISSHLGNQLVLASMAGMSTWPYGFEGIQLTPDSARVYILSYTQQWTEDSLAFRHQLSDSTRRFTFLQAYQGHGFQVTQVSISAAHP